MGIGGGFFSITGGANEGMGGGPLLAAFDGNGGGPRPGDGDGLEGMGGGPRPPEGEMVVALLSNTSFVVVPLATSFCELLVI